MDGRYFLQAIARDQCPTPLTQEQAERVYDRVRRDWEYVAKLKARLDVVGYRGTLLDREVGNAEIAMRRLSLMLGVMSESHYSGKNMRKLATKPPDVSEHGSTGGDWDTGPIPPLPVRETPNPMYLVRYVSDDGRDRYLFFWADPRREGCPYRVEEGVDFVELPPRDDHWKWGGSIPLDDMQDPILARSRRQPKKFKAFRTEQDVPAKGWDVLDGVGEVWTRWELFQKTIA